MWIFGRSRLTLGESGQVKSWVTEVRKIHTENNGKSRLPSEKAGLRYVKAGLQPGLPIVKTRLHLGSKLSSVNVDLSDRPKVRTTSIISSSRRSKLGSLGSDSS